MGARVKMELARIHAAETPKPGQDRKVAAIRDALGRRGLRVTLSPGQLSPSKRPCLLARNGGILAPRSGVLWSSREEEKAEATRS